MQMPDPSHACPVWTLPTHTVSPHAVPFGYSRHAPCPSQKPSRLQFIAPSSAQSSCGSANSLANPHTPSAPDALFFAVHAMHAPLHGVLQHTPSTQFLFRHSLAPTQGEPSAFF